MSEKQAVDKELIEAFNLMWRHFPGPVTLVDRRRTIIAANPAGLTIGREPGLNCAKLGPKEAHQDCLANQALADQKPKWVTREVAGVMKTIYWLPVEGYPDLYIHFAVG